LIIKEAHSGKISPRDTLLTLCLLGLCHSLIEDTAIMALIGGDLRVILLGRIVFAFAAIFLLNVALTKRPALQTVLYKISRSRPSN
jgi:hypothetical protein